MKQYIYLWRDENGGYEAAALWDDDKPNNAPYLTRVYGETPLYAAKNYARYIRGMPTGCPIDGLHTELGPVDYVFVDENGSIREVNEEEFTRAVNTLGRSLVYKAIVEDENGREEAAFNDPMDAADYLEQIISNFDRVEAHRIATEAFRKVQDEGLDWERKAYGKTFKLIVIEARRA